MYCEACLLCWSPSPAALGKETARNLDKDNKTSQQKHCFGFGFKWVCGSGRLGIWIRIPIQGGQFGVQKKKKK